MFRRNDDHQRPSLFNTVTDLLIQAGRGKRTADEAYSAAVVYIGDNTKNINGVEANDH